MNLDELTEEQRKSITDAVLLYKDTIDKLIEKYREQNAKAAKPKYKFAAGFVSDSFFATAPIGGEVQSGRCGNYIHPVYTVDRKRAADLLQAYVDAYNRKYLSVEDFLDSYLAKETE